MVVMEVQTPMSRSTTDTNPSSLDWLVDCLEFCRTHLYKLKDAEEAFVSFQSHEGFEADVSSFLASNRQMQARIRSMTLSVLYFAYHMINWTSAVAEEKYQLLPDQIRFKELPVLLSKLLEVVDKKVRVGRNKAWCASTLADNGKEVHAGWEELSPLISLMAKTDSSKEHLLLEHENRQALMCAYPKKLLLYLLKAISEGMFDKYEEIRLYLCKFLFVKAVDFYIFRLSFEFRIQDAQKYSGYPKAALQHFSELCEELKRVSQSACMRTLSLPPVHYRKDNTWFENETEQLMNDLHYTGNWPRYLEGIDDPEQKSRWATLTEVYLLSVSKITVHDFEHYPVFLPCKIYLLQPILVEAERSSVATPQFVALAATALKILQSFHLSVILGVKLEHAEDQKFLLGMFTYGMKRSTIGTVGRIVDHALSTLNALEEGVSSSLRNPEGVYTLEAQERETLTELVHAGIGQVLQPLSKNKVIARASEYRPEDHLHNLAQFAVRLDRNDPGFLKTISHLAWSLSNCYLPNRSNYLDTSGPFKPPRGIISATLVELNILATARTLLQYVVEVRILSEELKVCVHDLIKGFSSQENLEVLLVCPDLGIYPETGMHSTVPEVKTAVHDILVTLSLFMSKTFPSYILPEAEPLLRCMEKAWYAAACCESNAHDRPDPENREFKSFSPLVESLAIHSSKEELVPAICEVTYHILMSVVVKNWVKEDHALVYELSRFPDLILRICREAFESGNLKALLIVEKLLDKQWGFPMTYASLMHAIMEHDSVIAHLWNLPRLLAEQWKLHKDTPSTSFKDDDKLCRQWCRKSPEIQLAEVIDLISDLAYSVRVSLALLSSPDVVVPLFLDEEGSMVTRDSGMVLRLAGFSQAGLGGVDLRVRHEKTTLNTPWKDIVRFLWQFVAEEEIPDGPKSLGIVQQAVLNFLAKALWSSSCGGPKKGEILEGIMKVTGGPEKLRAGLLQSLRFTIGAESVSASQTTSKETNSINSNHAQSFVRAFIATLEHTLSMQEPLALAKDKAQTAAEDEAHVSDGGEERLLHEKAKRKKSKRKKKGQGKNGAASSAMTPLEDSESASATGKTSYIYEEEVEKIKAAMKHPLPDFVEVVKRSDWLRYRQRARNGIWKDVVVRRRQQFAGSYLSMESLLENCDDVLNVLDRDHVGLYGESFRYFEVTIQKLGLAEREERKQPNGTNFSTLKDGETHSALTPATKFGSISIGTAVWDTREDSHLGRSRRSGPNTFSFGFTSKGYLIIDEFYVIFAPSPLVEGDCIGIGVDAAERCIVVTKNGKLLTIVGCCRYARCSDELWRAEGERFHDPSGSSSSVFQRPITNLNCLQLGAAVVDGAAIHINGGGQPFRFDFGAWRKAKLAQIRTKAPAEVECHREHADSFNLTVTWPHDEEVDVFGNFSDVGHAVVDNAVPRSLSLALAQRLESFANKRPVVYRSGIDCQIRDLIHPSLYPCIWTNSLRKNPSQFEAKSEYLDDFAFPYFGEMTADVAMPTDINAVPKTDYYWLPTDLKVDDQGQVTFLSYVNNLDSKPFKKLQNDLGKLFALALPLFEQALGYADAFRLNQEYQGPQNLRYRNLQVIFAAEDYVLEPGESFEGEWGLCGLPQEHIVAKGIYYVEPQEPLIEDKGLGFRKAASYDREIHEDLQFGYGSDSLGGFPNTMYIGNIEAKEGRMIVFTNNVQHKLLGLNNKSLTEVARRRMVSFYLINPDLSVISTSDIPEQQHSYQETVQLLDGILNRARLETSGAGGEAELPPETLFRIATFAHYPGLTFQAALNHQENLLRERHEYVKTINTSLEFVSDFLRPRRRAIRPRRMRNIFM